MLRRVKQFFSAIQAKVNKEDLLFVKLYLTGPEKHLFLKMDAPTQKHAIKVARTVLKLVKDRTLVTHGKNYNINMDLLVKAALLHDSGKPAGCLKTWHRVVIVLLEKFLTKKSFKKLCLFASSEDTRHTGLCFALYLQKNHPKLGGSLARQYNLDPKLIYLIENHHNLDCNSSSLELRLLQKADELN